MRTRTKSPRPTRKPAATVPQPARNKVAARPPGALLARPAVYVPAVLMPDGAGGWSVKPGKPVVRAVADEITTAEAARLLGYSQTWVGHLCDEGAFKTARKKGPSSRSMWMINRAEVLAFVS